MLVQIHVENFENFFLTNLGFDFLLIYYEALLSMKESIALGLYYKSKLVGFSIGVTISSGINKKILKSNFKKFLLVGVKIIICNPKIIFRLLRGFNKKELIKNDFTGELLSISIDKKHRNNGYGKTLLSAFEKEMKAKGMKYLSLTTDFSNNKSVNQFYSSNGYLIQSTFQLSRDRIMNRYIKEI